MSKTSSKEIPNESILLNNLLQTYLESKSGLELNQNPEVEVKFGTLGIKHITKINFDNVIKQLLSNNFRFHEESKYYLRISSESIRTEIIGLKNIQEYCRNNKLPSEVTSDGHNFTEKKLYRPSSIVNFNDFNFRVSYNIETSLSTSNPIIERLLHGWNDTKKFYRLINRFTMVHDDFPVIIDLSIVRDSRRDSREKKYDIKETDIFNQNFKYEIEIELDNDKIATIDPEQLTSELLSRLLKKISKIILSGLQETNFPTSYQEQTQVLDSLSRLVKKEKYKGPASVTLQMMNIAPINEDMRIINIRTNYTVTDKADGDRKMLYVSSNGKIYLVTSLMSIEFTGAETHNKEMFDSLLDGEHIKHNRSGQFINLYMAFDIYFRKGDDVRSLAFVPEKGDDIETNFRLPLLTKFIRTLEPVLINTKNLSPIRINYKTFYGVNKKQSIFDGCKKIMERIENEEYETDGLIFTPMHLGVGANKVGDNPHNTGKTWNHSFKWKPAIFNTIDFLITTKKTPTGAEFIGNVFESGINTSTLDQIVQYKTVILRVGYRERSDGYINPCENIINDNYPMPGEIDAADKYKPVQFFPTNPYDPDAGITNIPLRLDTTNEKQMFTEENEVIEDNTIVEFRYDMTRDKQWRWIPLRVRYDKTADYRMGGNNYGNAYRVAQSNWQSIHHPITEEMITTGKYIPDEIDDDIYYNMFKGETRTRALRDFHNKYVKKKLIISVANAGDTLIDYAVGKGGDLQKWIDAKLQFVFGLDLSRDNIENRLDGVCARYLDRKRTHRIMPDALFIQGNSGQNIKNLSAQYTEKGKAITKAIFGEGSKEDRTLGAGVLKSYGKGVDGFNISSIQFAIHYMFENVNTLHNFLTNVAECTKLGGYFIGTSYDGKKIFEQLKDKKQNESLTIMDRDNNKLLEITKQYDRDEFTDNISCLGYGINVFQESINKTFREYLVNYDYLISVIENYGFVRLTVKEAAKLNLHNGIGNFRELYELMKDEIKKDPSKKADYGNAYKMTAEQRTISFLNKYFIFKKVRNVDVGDIKVGLLQETPAAQEEKLKESLLAQQDIKDAMAEIESEKPLVVKPAQKKKRVKLVPVKKSD